MANNLRGKLWTLGSATLGNVTETPIAIESITITWSGASDGNVLLNEPFVSEGSINSTILAARTLGVASATNAFNTLTQTFPFYGAIFQGLTAVALTGVSGDTGVQILVR